MESLAENSDPIFGLWKPARAATSEFLGLLRLGDRPTLEFPLLTSEDLAPTGTTVFHGVSTDTDRHTALTLPARNHGIRGASTGDRSFNLNLRVLAVLSGKQHVECPEDLLVSEISFAPSPNAALHASTHYQYFCPSKDIVSIEFAPDVDEEIKAFKSAQSAFFSTGQHLLLEAYAPTVGNVSAYLGGSRNSGVGQHAEVRFSIRFETPCLLREAEEEAHIFCAFLTLVSHSFVMPTAIGVRAGEREFYRLVVPRYHGASEGAPNSHPLYSLVLPDKSPEEFGRVLRNWYRSNSHLLGSRLLHRQSLSEPLLFSNERFLAVFNAIEGLLKAAQSRQQAKYVGKLLNEEELSEAINAVRSALPSNDKLDAFINGMKNSNSVSPREAFSLEVSDLLNSVGATFEEGDMATFMSRVFQRRNRIAHGSRKPGDAHQDTLTLDTVMLTAIYIMLDAQIVGIDPLDACHKFGGAQAWHPFKYDVPNTDAKSRLAKAWADDQSRGDAN